MKRPLLIALSATAAVAVVAAVIILNLTRPTPAPDEALPGSKDSNVTATPTPTATATNSAPQSTIGPTPVPSWPAECVDEDTAPAYCMNLLPPGAGPTVTPEQMAAEADASAFAAQWGSFRSDEPASTRAGRLTPFLAPSAQGVATQKTLLGRPDTRLTGLTAVATATILYSTFTEADSDGHWVYTVQATYNGTYTQQGTGSVSNFSGPATFTVTVDPGTKKVLAVSESIPTLQGAP